MSGSTTSASSSFSAYVEPGQHVIEGIVHPIMNGLSENHALTPSQRRSTS